MAEHDLKADSKAAHDNQRDDANANDIDNTDADGEDDGDGSSSSRSVGALPPALGLVLGAEAFDARDTAGISAGSRHSGNNSNRGPCLSSAALRSAQAALYGDGNIVVPAGALRAVRRAVELAMRERATLLLSGGGGALGRVGGGASGSLRSEEGSMDERAKQSLIG